MLAETNVQKSSSMPDWVPDEARRYLAHVEAGHSIRSIARQAGCHASTVLRQVRRTEQRREDLLVDLALSRLRDKRMPFTTGTASEGATKAMTIGETVHENSLPDDQEFRTTASRVLRRMNERGASLAIARDMEKAVVVREMPDGETIRTAIVDRAVAEAMALKDWLTQTGEGRIARYQISGPGRMALRRILAEEEAMRVGMGEGADPASEQHRDWVMRHASGDKNKKYGIRYNAAESPLSILARRKDKDGQAFLQPDLVAAGERLREDFELSQLGPRVTQN